MVTAAAVSVGIVIFGAALAASLRATVQAKTTLPSGAFQVFDLQVPVPVPQSDTTWKHATSVTVTAEDATVTQGHRASVVLGVDPTTFARGAFWESSFASSSLSDLLRRIKPNGATGRVPVIAVGGALPDQLTITLPGTGGSVSLSAHVVSRARNSRAKKKTSHFLSSTGPF